jgi:hypothetical protein
VRSGSPRSACAIRLSFSAVSTASDPPLVKKTRLPGTGARATSRSASSSARGFEKRSKQW